MLQANESAVEQLTNESPAEQLANSRTSIELDVDEQLDA